MANPVEPSSEGILPLYDNTPTLQELRKEALQLYDALDSTQPNVDQVLKSIQPLSQFFYHVSQTFPVPYHFGDPYLENVYRVIDTMPVADQSPSSGVSVFATDEAESRLLLTEVLKPGHEPSLQLLKSSLQVFSQGEEHPNASVVKGYSPVSALKTGMQWLVTQEQPLLQSDMQHIIDDPIAFNFLNDWVTLYGAIVIPQPEGIEPLYACLSNAVLHGQKPSADDLLGAWQKFMDAT